MPLDSKDNSGYDNLYVSGKNKESSGGYLPLGSGRKSEFALGSKSKNSYGSIVKSESEPKKTGSSAKSGGSKKKTSSADQSKKKRPSDAKKQSYKKNRSEGTKKQTAAKSSSAVKKSAHSSYAAAPAARPDKPKKSPAAAKSSSKQTSSKQSHSKKSSKKKRFQKEELISYAYLGAMAAGGVFKKTLGSRRKRLVAVLLLMAVLLIGCGYYLRTIYTSKTMFSDDGKNLDETAIEERLITDEQNKDKVTYFLIVGVDKSQSLTDCIWIMCFDNAAHKMNVLQIPRDTYVGEDSKALGKINGVYKTPKTVDWCEQCGKQVFEDEIRDGTHSVCGLEVTKKTESNINAVIRVIKERLSLPIDHYVLFDFEGFEKVIDAMGGVDIFLDEEMKVWPNKKTYITLPAGNNHLDGATALKYMRTRKNYRNGDLGRVAGQRNLIKAMFDKVDKLSSLEALKILKAAYGNFKTDMSLEEIRSFISPVKKCGADRLHMFELPGNDRWVKPHPSYYVCDEEKTAEMINEYMLPYSNKITAYNISFPDLGY